MKYRDIIKIIEADGWLRAPTNGSHRMYQHPAKVGNVTVPVHSLGHDVPIGLRQAILKQAGVKLMAKFTAVVEHGDDGSWSAYTLSPSLVVGSGATKDAAIDDVRVAMSLWLDYMKETGQPPVSTELVSFEVAA